MTQEAAALAEANVARWGIGDAVTIRVGDIRELAGAGNFDVVTLHQNIYYFPEDGWVDLFRHLGTFLRPTGRLLVTTMCRGGGVNTAGLDLWGAMTSGCSRLPIATVLADRMRAAGLTDVVATKLSHDGMYHALVGVRP